MPKVYIKGSIIRNNEKWIYDYYEMESTCPNDVAKILAINDGTDVEIEINSGGGDIFAGSEIYTMLRAEKRRKVSYIVGMAASAASVIAMATECYISPTAMMMVHNVSSGASGDYNVMNKTSQILQIAGQSIAQAYVDKSGISIEDALDMMNEETYLTAQQAKEKGLVDGIMFEKQVITPMVASFQNGMIPQNIINKMQNEKLEKMKAGKKLELENKFKLLQGGI